MLTYPMLNSNFEIPCVEELLIVACDEPSLSSISVSGIFSSAISENCMFWVNCNYWPGKHCMYIDFCKNINRRAKINC